MKHSIRTGKSNEIIFVLYLCDHRVVEYETLSFHIAVRKQNWGVQCIVATPPLEVGVEVGDV